MGLIIYGNKLGINMAFTVLIIKKIKTCHLKYDIV